MLIERIRSALVAIIERIDNGTCDMTEDEQCELLDCINRINSPWVSKYEACKILGVSRATFDRMVADGKIPKGRATQGLKELMWRKHDILRH